MKGLALHREDRSNRSGWILKRSSAPLGISAIAMLSVERAI